MRVSERVYYVNPRTGHWISCRLDEHADKLLTDGGYRRVPGNEYKLFKKRGGKVT